MQAFPTRSVLAMYSYIFGSFAAILWFIEVEQVHLLTYWGHILTVVLSDPRRCRMLLASILRDMPGFQRA